MGGGFGGSGEGLTEEQQKKMQREAVEQAERSLKEAEADYLKTSKELASISRKRAELERRAGEVTPGKPKAEGAFDQIQRVAGIVSQVQEEAAKFRQGGRSSREGTGFIRVGDYVIDTNKIIYVRFTKDRSGKNHAEIHLAVGEQLPLDGEDAEALERQLMIRGR